MQADDPEQSKRLIEKNNLERDADGSMDGTLS
jgi:hypothetical protein